MAGRNVANCDGEKNVTNCGGNSREQQTDELVKGPMPPLSRTFLRIPMFNCTKQPRYTTPTTMAAPEAAAADRRPTKIRGGGGGNDRRSKRWRR